MRQIPVLVPSEDEQAAIVRFLDHANRKIDGFIRAKRKLIGLLNEQKQAIIHRAVTGKDEVRMVKDENGNSSFILQPSTLPKKPSGIPWLGDIPKHWAICPIKQTLLRMDYGTSESSTGDGKYRVLTMGHIQNGRVLVPDEAGINQIPAGLSLKTNDLLFNRTNSPELVGKVGIFRGSNEPPVTFASYLVRLRVRLEHNPIWLNYLLNSFRFWAFARSQALVSLHQANLNSSRYGRMNIPVPPRADQDSIVEHIFTETSTIDTAIARTEREIALMQEYRTRLTADLVTGKLDVREAAARLPEEKSDVADTSEMSDLSEEPEEPPLEEES
jgi:type I restriction enzyme S subunit